MKILVCQPIELAGLGAPGKERRSISLKVTARPAMQIKATVTLLWPVSPDKEDLEIQMYQRASYGYEQVRHHE